MSVQGPITEGALEGYLAKKGSQGRQWDKYIFLSKDIILRRPLNHLTPTALVELHYTATQTRTEMLEDVNAQIQ